MLAVVPSNYTRCGQWRGLLTQTASVYPKTLRNESKKFRQQQCARATALHTSFEATPAAHLQSAIPLCLLHVPTPAARLQSSGCPYLEVERVYLTHLEGYRNVYLTYLEGCRTCIS